MFLFRPRWNAPKTNQLSSKMCTAVFEPMLSSWVGFLRWCPNCVLMNRKFHTVQLWHRWADSISKSISVLFVGLWKYEKRVSLNLFKSLFTNIFCRKILIDLILGQSLGMPQTTQGYCSGTLPKMPHHFFICSRETFIMPLNYDARTTFFNGAAVCKLHHFQNLSNIANWWALCVYYVFLIT